MKNEYNFPPDEYVRAGEEYSEAEETQSFAGNKEAEETSLSAGEYPAGNPRTKRVAGKKGRDGIKNIGNIVKCFFAVTVTVAVAVIAVSASADVNAEFLSLSVTDTALSYAVNYEGDRNAELVVYNDFTRRKVALKNGENEGEVSGLKSDMKYTVAIVYQSGLGEKSVIEQMVRTDKYAARKTELYAVEHECKCNVDGYFHFRLDFIDENARWTQFAAFLEDEYGNVSYCIFNEDVHAEQVIDVALKAGLLGKSATFTVTCKTAEPVAGADTLVLYSATVLI